MKYSKAVYVTAHDINGNLNREYDVYTNRVVKNKDYSEVDYANKDFACQYDSNRETNICTCKRTKGEGYRYFNTSRQVYRSQRYTSARGFTDVGVGSIKTVPRKRVKRIYLPDTEDRGVGSADLSSFIRRTKNGPISYYDQKKTSSKCVGGVIEIKNIPVLTEKLSPICKTKSGSTSPKKISCEEKKNIDNHCIIPDPVVNVVMGKKHVRRENINKEQGTPMLQETFVHISNADKRNEPNTSNIKSSPAVTTNERQDFSSDSLVQHVHNLEDPSSFKHSKSSIDSMLGNKLEKEYIKMFSQISRQGKPIAEVHPVQNSRSVSFRKRFEALRRGLSKKEDSLEHGVVIKTSSQNSTLSRKDVSITSDPPSLEARSYMDAKIYSPVPSPLYNYQNMPQTSYRKSVSSKNRSSHWSTEVADSDCQNVQGMLKLWGKKFNFEEDCYETKTLPCTTPDETPRQKKKVELILPKEEIIESQKKEGKKFLFFRKKTKEKGKQPYKSKKGVTAGRCEVGDGLTIRIGAANDVIPEIAKKKSEQVPDVYDDMFRKAWLKRCLDSKNDSRNSVKIRWNNEMYATSSSTVFELMECVYKNTGILFTSRSEMTATTTPTNTTLGSPYYHAKNQEVNFMQQTVEAWMIPKIVKDKSLDIQKTKNKNEEASFFNQKWYIDKSKAFSQKIELVLHSKNFVKDDVSKSSEYIVIDIPKGYFLETSSDDEESQSSDERVFNIVEYETAKSSSYLNKKGKDGIKNTEDHEILVNVNLNEDKETNVLEKDIKAPLLHRDVLVQGSNVYVPKRCDVISVGIITQHTHNRDIKNRMLRMQDDMTDEESLHTLRPQKKCELAESYLQDYYRNWIPLGMDLYSWCISDSNLRVSSDNNSLTSFNNQGDGSKSCPNIYDDYQASFVSSSTTSRSQCMIVGELKPDDTTTTYYNKLKKNTDEPQQMNSAGAEGKRVLPKDSVEVFKRRKIYADSNVKADWCDQVLEPLCKPSILDKFAQKLSNDSACLGNQKKKKLKKHVSLKDFKKVGESIMSFKGSSGCKKCKKKGQCSKHALVMPELKCEMIPPCCLDSCIKKKKPPCSKKGSPTCLVPPPPICPVGPPSPCQPACPPVPPPCASYIKEISPSKFTLPPSTASRSFSRFLSYRKKCSPQSPQQKSSSTPHSPRASPPQSPKASSPNLPPTQPTTTKGRSLSRFLRRSKQKTPCIDSCSKQQKPPCSTKDSSPCGSLHKGRPHSPQISPPRSPRTSPPGSPKTSPPQLPPATASKPRSFSRFFSSNPKQKPSCKEECSKLKNPPCSTKDSSPCVLLPDPSPSVPPSSSPSSHQKPPNKDSGCKLKKLPFLTRKSSPCTSSPPSPPYHSHSPNLNPPTSTKLSSPSSQASPNHSGHPIPPHRSKFSSPSYIPNKSSDLKEKCLKTKDRCPCLSIEKSSLPKSHLRPTKSSPLTSAGNSPSSQSNQLCGCNLQNSCGLPTCPTSKKSPYPGQELPNTLKKQLSPNCSGINLKKSASNKNAEASNRLIEKSNSPTTKKESGDCNHDFPHKIDQEEGSIQLISSQPFCQPIAPKPRSQSKMSGLHLKKLPMPRNLSNEIKPSCKVIKLNSKENLTIRTKPNTPSTEEIRESCNIKVQDEDGQTLYERREYKIDTAQARKHLVQDMYKDSQIHRVSTTKADIMDEEKLECRESKSNTSLSNIVEINLNLKFKQIDKTTDLNIKKCTDISKDNQSEKLNSQVSNDIYALQEKTNRSIDPTEDLEKRDVNIKIIINSYQQNPAKPKRKTKHPILGADDEFSRKISEKFHTVSTGYSDVLDAQTYSIHRTTVNFTDSTDISKHTIIPSKEIVNQKLTEQGTLTDIELITQQLKSEPSSSLITQNYNEKVDTQVLPSDTSQIKYSEINLENSVDICDEKSTTAISLTENEEALFSDVQHSDLKIYKKRNKEEKKKILKQIFEDSTSSKKTSNKSKIRSIRKMLRAVLTSDSSGYEDDSTNHKMVKELTYESLKPNFFKDSESMTNYYKIDSSISDYRSSLNEIEEMLHPTELNNSLNSAEIIQEKPRCLCSHLAAKLHMCEKNNFKACCCRDNSKRDEEINCNLIEDVRTKTNYVDVETQDSNLKAKMKKPSITISANTLALNPQVNETKKSNFFSKIPRRLFSYSSSVKVCKLNRQTVLELSDDEKNVLNSKSNDSKPEHASVNSDELEPIDILQLYETKKAVLEIYAEKTELNETEEHLVAKLPKFIYKTESGFCNYEEMFANVHEFNTEILF